MPEDMVTIRLPRRDVDALVHVLEDIELLSRAEKGDDEISKGKFKTLEEIGKV